MDTGKILKDLLDRNEQYVLRGFDELTHDQLKQRVAPDANPLGWLMWHLARVQDRTVAGMTGVEQLWIRDGWHFKFGKGPDPEERGNGDTSEQVGAFVPPDAATLIAYYKAAREQTDAFLGNLDNDDPQRLVPGSGKQMVPLAERLPGLILEIVQHGGQIAYAKGIVSG